MFLSVPAVSGERTWNVWLFPVVFLDSYIYDMSGHVTRVDFRGLQRCCECPFVGCRDVCRGRSSSHVHIWLVSIRGCSLLQLCALLAASLEGDVKRVSTS